MLFDHLVLVVRDLPSASQHFSRLGFNVVPGGEHPSWGTHNALIGLQDGSYLELLAATRPWRAAFYRLLGSVGILGLATRGKPFFHSRFIRHLAAGEGLADFALLSEDLERDVQAARARGLDMAGPFEGSRRKPDGQQIAWRTAETGSAALPFLIEDLTPREWRVPTGSSSSHPNGAAGVVALQVGCRVLERVASRYQLLLSLEPEIETGSDGVPARACFRLAVMDLVLVPAEEMMAMRRREAAPQTISLTASNHATALVLRYSTSMGYSLDPA